MSDETRLSDPAAELAILTACLDSKNARIEARKHLLASDFWDPAHETIYNAMVALDRHGKSVDLVTVRAALEAQGHQPHQLAGLQRTLVDLFAGVGSPGSVADYAAIVHQWAQRRKLLDSGQRQVQRATDPAESPARLAAQAVTELTGIRDSNAGDTTAVTLGELMDQPDDTPTWVIPGLLEHSDRLMLTGSEGAGKSNLSRQLVIMAAAGLHPFQETVMPPIRALILDAENKTAQIRRQTRPLLEWLRHQGVRENPMERVLVDAIAPRRINLCNDRDLSRVHQTLDAWQPDLVVLGPIYKMSPRALQTDDEAHPFLAAIDTITERGCAVIVEAHAGHSTEGQGKTQARSLRPRGSSALLGWPEFGLGLRAIGGGVADLEPWRGGREERAWPHRLMRAPGHRWVECSPDWRPPVEGMQNPFPPGDRAESDPQGSLV